MPPLWLFVGGVERVDRSAGQRCGVGGNTGRDFGCQASQSMHYSTAPFCWKWGALALFFEREMFNRTPISAKFPHWRMAHWSFFAAPAFAGFCNCYRGP
jgi:hypothetical protein